MLKTEDDYGGGGGGGGGDNNNGWSVNVNLICEACESAPAAFVCKADSASLCSACDAEIHSANPLARRHHRVPILTSQHQNNDNDDDEAASWLLLNPPALKLPNTTNNNNNNGMFLLGGEEEEDDEYLNFVEFNTCGDANGFVDEDDDENHEFQGLKNYGGGGEDSVVPVDHFQPTSEFESPKTSIYSYNAFLTNTTVSVSSMEVGVVPESTTVSDMSMSTARPAKGTIDLFSGTVAVQMPATQLSPMDREARVLRYREKKKMRKFEKTIRYASRKAYAETRPRIKGRFAKRTDVEVQLNRKFSNPLMADTGYGIVPSF